MPAKKTTGDKTYILELRDGNIRKISIPSHWKMTYGSIVPYNVKQQNPGTRSDYALRLYEGSKENLRAVMTDVVAIRDASIGISEKRTTIQRQGAQKQTAHGMKNVTVEARVTEWVNPDADEDAANPNEFLKQLPSAKTDTGEL